MRGSVQAMVVSRSDGTSYVRVTVYGVSEGRYGSIWTQGYPVEGDLSDPVACAKAMARALSDLLP